MEWDSAQEQKYYKNCTHGLVASGGLSEVVIAGRPSALLNNISGDTRIVRNNRWVVKIVEISNSTKDVCEWNGKKQKKNYAK